MNAAPGENAAALSRYYQFHAHIYDATRWAFLFGRQRLLKLLATETQPTRILEIGCGTGYNLARLARQFPSAQLTGVDVSNHMLQRAANATAFCSHRVHLVEQPYQTPLQPGGFDLIVCSYSLSMINPGWQQVLASCREDLSPSGKLAVVDFHHSRFASFRRWMGVNHVRMEGHLLETLERDFSLQHRELCAAYGGVWAYLLVIASPSLG